MEKDEILWECQTCGTKQIKHIEDLNPVCEICGCTSDNGMIEV